MKPSKQSLFELFERQRRYVVPLFQRPYVWRREQEWEPLWEDISEKALAAAQRQRSYPHFLGAVVLNQIKVFGRQVDTAEIIDGQQRLTTLQVFLAAFRDLAASLEAPLLHDRLTDLTQNRYIMQDEFERFKVWPTNADRDVFESVMTATSQDVMHRRHPALYEGRKLVPRPRLVEAYLYFYEAIKAFVHAPSDDGDVNTSPLVRMEAIDEAFRHHLQVVVIELEDDDDPQVIFETLNARGVPLLPSDLIRNYIFLRATRRGEDQDRLYQRWWKHYDDEPPEPDVKGPEPFWKREEKQGRLRRPRLDLFFQYYLEYRTGEDIKIGHLFQSFKAWWESGTPERTAENELREFRRHSDVFRTFFVPDSSSRVGLFARRLQLLDVGTIYPLLLLLFVERYDEVDPAELEGIVADLESYLVRRIVCNLTTKQYNQKFGRLLRALRAAPRVDRSTLRTHLLESEGDSVRWPADREFERNWLSQPVYRFLKSPRITLLLEAIDQQLMTEKQEGVHLPKKLTVEHVMPEKWRDSWPAPTELFGHSDRQHEDPDERRDRVIHTLGNLTLLTQALNTSVSNGPYNAKRPAITQQSQLRLNAYFQNVSTWDEQGIEERGRALFAVAKTIWPHPTTGQSDSLVAGDAPRAAAPNATGPTVTQSRAEESTGPVTIARSESSSSSGAGKRGTLGLGTRVRPTDHGNDVRDAHDFMIEKMREFRQEHGRWPTVEALLRIAVHCARAGEWTPKGGSEQFRTDPEGYFRGYVLSAFRPDREIFEYDYDD